VHNPSQAEHDGGDKSEDEENTAHSDVDSMAYLKGLADDSDLFIQADRVRSVWIPLKISVQTHPMVSQKPCSKSCLPPPSTFTLCNNPAVKADQPNAQVAHA